MTTGPRRIAARLAALAVTVTGAVAFIAAPAHAGGVVPNNLATSPSLTAPSSMDINIIEIPGTGFHVCTTGIATVTGTWTTTIDGVRYNAIGSATFTMSRSATGKTWTTNNCFDVTENGAPAGEFTLRFTFNNGSAIFARAGGGAWELGSENSWDTGY